MFEQLREVSADFEESMCWTVIRPHQARLTVDDVLRRLRGDPDTMTTYRPVDVGYDDDVVFLEQRGDAVIVVGYSVGSDEEDVLRRLSQDATVHEVFWLINNFNRLYYAVDGVLVTELDVLCPQDRWGADPDALTDHLDALRDLRDRERGPFPDWETAMATVESLTGLGLDAGWFDRPQLFAKINRR
ncbi:DUF6461 domain-containing protein [Micromonospora soli]|uniref:DUF6461 domain-containing protein n=1 Tax=Micromonospora sp. NBRC 110009 TaxID=3061627 RepID=UPI002673D0F2|nr:DUF6461 domain-containing protein [Micromonospora sp. NBRC 110009]WKT98688.1 DUF6461 domain-containing protein [Micromonospora sp. NBRC 110009]